MPLILLTLLAMICSVSAWEIAADTTVQAENQTPVTPPQPLDRDSTAKVVQNWLRAAEQARQQAEALGYEWSTIRPLLEQADAALAAGDQTLALTLLRKAKKQADLAIAQAKYADENWHIMVPPTN